MMARDVARNPVGPLDPSISVVSVVWNSRDCLEPFLESIRRQADVGAVEIVLVDNGSTDGSREYLRRQSDLRLIESERNLGYGGGMNLGVAAATGECVVLSNPDLEIASGALSAMRHALSESDDVGGVGPVVLTSEDSSVASPHLATDPGLYYGWNFFSGFMDRFADSRWINFNLDFHPERNENDLAWLHGCCGMYRRAAFDSVGGFDDGFFLYFEDCDLGRRLRTAGWRLRMAREAQVLHREGESTAVAGTTTRTFFMESWQRYHRKHSSALFRAAAFTLVTVALGLQLAVQAVKRGLGRGSPSRVIEAYWTAHWRRRTTSTAVATAIKQSATRPDKTVRKREVPS